MLEQWESVACLLFTLTRPFWRDKRHKDTTLFSTQQVFFLFFLQKRKYWKKVPFSITQNTTLFHYKDAHLCKGLTLKIGHETANNTKSGIPKPELAAYLTLFKRSHYFQGRQWVFYTLPPHSKAISRISVWLTTGISKIHRKDAQRILCWHYIVNNKGGIRVVFLIILEIWWQRNIEKLPVITVTWSSPKGSHIGVTFPLCCFNKESFFLPYTSLWMSLNTSFFFSVFNASLSHGGS
jgi:hypothetical protein